MYLLKGYKIPSDPVRDPIYGFIDLPKAFKPIIDNKIFQRLRWINQLPLEQLVYPSAQHSRLEHSFGAMYLAMLASISLLINSEETVFNILNTDDDFSPLREEDKEKYFILSAGLCGLLHDLGHAPFSHTLEEATKFSTKKWSYDHEKIGYFVAKQLLDDARKIGEIFSKKVLNVLNKKLTPTTRDLSPLEIILRKLIDGPIDIDKGDYLIRDSYHCGVSYGKYDINRLFRNIKVTKDYHIGVTPKAAIEAWNLRICRYSMKKNVYEHHTRHITDSLLIGIISEALDQIGDNWNYDIMPFKNPEHGHDNHNELTNFVFWTDNSLIKALQKADKGAYQGRIENFVMRKLLKRGSTINLANYPDIVDAKSMLNEELKKHKQKFKAKGWEVGFLITKDVPPPVFEKEVQSEILVVDGDVTQPLAEYLNFSVAEEDREKYTPLKEETLHIFIEEAAKQNKDKVREETIKILDKF